MAEIVDFGLQQHKIKMDSRYFENVLSVVAGDTGRRLEVQLLDTNGTVQDTTGLNLRLNAEIAGKATFTDATLVDAANGKYQLDLSNGMFLAPGNWQFQWQITDSAGKKLHSFAFTGNIGKNISEGGSQATNFYFNLEDLKAMQEDLINGTFNSEVLETNITEKLTDLETQYAPKLTEVTAQLAHNTINENTTRNPVVSLNTHKNKRTLVTFIDDDGSTDVLTKLKPLSEKYGVPFVIALIGNYIETGVGVNVEQALDLQNRLGWEIASHEYNHVPLNESQYTRSDYEYEILDSLRFLRSKGFDVKNMVYPYGRTNNEIKEITAIGYNSGVGTNFGMNKSPVEMYDLRRIAFPQEAPNNNLAWYKSQVDLAKSDNAWLLWMLHCGQPIHDVVQQQILDDLIAYIKSLNVDISTIQEGLEIRGNVFSVNDNQFYMGSDGKNNMVNYVSSPLSVATGMASFNGTTLPNGFELNKMYTTQIASVSDRSTMPVNTQGVFTTVMTDSFTNSYQEFITASYRFKRHSTSNNSWSTWVTVVETTGHTSVLVSGGTIPPKGVLTKTIPMTFYNFAYQIIMTPLVLVPVGVVFSYQLTGSGGSIRITFFNGTDGEVTLPAGNWVYSLIKY